MKTRIALASLAIPLVLLGACSRQEEIREIDWAKAALERNPALEIISTDEAAGIFTVQDTTTGVVFKVHSNELIAAPPPPKAPPPVAAQPAAPPAPETPVEVEKPAQPGEAAASQTTAMAQPEAGTGDALAQGPGYSISRGEAQAATRPATLEGPGYSITREAPAAGPAAPDAEAVAAAAASTVEKRTDPIVCQGDRLMRIDGETFEFTGNAIIAENGCDLYISNVRIRASGVGIIARQARVHIVNSNIGGSEASYEASEGAQIYVARSTVAGVGRRFDTARMNDLGGNEYTLEH